MFSKLWCARVCYAIFLGSKNATLHSKIEHTANHFTVIQTLRVSKSTFSLIEIILKVHIHLSMTHRVSRMQNQEIKSFSTTYPSPIVQGRVRTQTWSGHLYALAYVLNNFWAFAKHKCLKPLLNIIQVDFLTEKLSTKCFTFL